MGLDAPYVLFLFNLTNSPEKGTSSGDRISSYQVRHKLQQYSDPLPGR